jgi:hypothetical protein
MYEVHDPKLENLNESWRTSGTIHVSIIMIKYQINFSSQIDYPHNVSSFSITTGEFWG